MSIMFFTYVKMWSRIDREVLFWLSGILLAGIFGGMMYVFRPSQFDGPKSPVAEPPWPRDANPSADPFARRDEETASLRRSRAEIMP
jgi:hypothetical protein